MDLPVWTVPINIDGKQVIAHGSLIITAGEVISLKVAPNLQIDVLFVDKSGYPGTVSKTGKDNTVRIELWNMGGLADSNTEPIEVGTVGLKKIFMDLLTFGSGTGPNAKKAFIYTLTLER